MQKIDAKDLFNINFYKSSPFYGSFQGMNYRVIKYAPANDADAQNESNNMNGNHDTECLRVSTWPGPYIYDVTPDDQKIHADFPFSNEGLVQVVEYLNRIWEENYHSA